MLGPRSRQFLETGLVLTDIVEFQGEKTIVLKLFQSTGLQSHSLHLSLSMNRSLRDAVLDHR